MEAHDFGITNDLTAHHLVRHASLPADAFQALGVFRPPGFFGRDLAFLGLPYR